MFRKCFLICVVLSAFTMESIEGRRRLLRPISASAVRQLLKDAGREDALPEGRVISHGLAAVKGFALGFKKGVIGVALADSLASLSSSNNTSSSSVNSKPSFSYNGTTHEICFTSRSATSDIVGSGEGRQAPTTATLPTNGPTGTTTNTSPTVGTTGVTTTGASPTTVTTMTNVPTTTATMTNTMTGTGTGSQTGTGTVTTTQTGGGTVNCIVFNKA